MSAAQEFRRLLEYASQRLAAEDERVVAKFMKVHELTTETYDGDARRVGGARVMKDLASYTAAVTYARLVMDMVTTFLKDGEPEEVDSRD